MAFLIFRLTRGLSTFNNKVQKKCPESLIIWARGKVLLNTILMFNYQNIIPAQPDDLDLPDIDIPEPPSTKLDEEPTERIPAFAANMDGESFINYLAKKSA